MAVDNTSEKDGYLSIDISDALSEKDKVKFTIHTKTNMPTFQEKEFSVIREHEEFVWLHDCYEDCDEFAGYIIPPAPPKPNFESSREKLQKLGEGESLMSKEEFTYMKQELEAEYLSTFKKTVAIHELFLCRLAAHPTLKNFHNFRVFLEYDQNLNVRGKNNREKLEQLLKTVSLTMDETLLSKRKEIDEYYDEQKSFYMNFTARMKDAVTRGEKVVKFSKAISEDYSKMSVESKRLSDTENPQLERFLLGFGQGCLEFKKHENRIASDLDLKLCDMLRYFYQDACSAKSLIFRRLRALSDFEGANRNMEKARIKGRDIAQAETEQIAARNKFNQLSEIGKKELKDFKDRRLQISRKNLIEMTELQIKHAKALEQAIRSTLVTLIEIAKETNINTSTPHDNTLYTINHKPLISNTHQSTNNSNISETTLVGQENNESQNTFQKLLNRRTEDFKSSISDHKSKNNTKIKQNLANLDSESGMTDMYDSMKSSTSTIGTNNTNNNLYSSTLSEFS